MMSKDDEQRTDVFSEDDYWAIVLNRYTKDGGLPYGDQQRLKKLNEHAKAKLVESRIDEAWACDNLILNTGPHARTLIKGRITALKADLQGLGEAGK